MAIAMDPPLVSAAAAVEPLERSDKVTIGIICFFMLIAVTLEAYWITFHNSMESRTDFFAKMLSIYWPADRTYRIPGYGIDKSFTLAVESVNVVVLQCFNALLIYAIVKRRAYRHALQLTIATIAGYGTVLYYYVAHLSGYAVFENHRTSTYLLFYLSNAPWLIGCTWMAYSSIRAIIRRFQTT